MNDSPDFYLASTESYALDEPRGCWRIKRLPGDKRDNYLLARIAPALNGATFGLGPCDITKVILATRLEGFTLFPITRWPVYVHVAVPLINDPEQRDVIQMDELQSLAWGELYESEEAAWMKSR
jgi:hypothetical protein